MQCLFDSSKVKLIMDRLSSISNTEIPEIRTIYDRTWFRFLTVIHISDLHWMQLLQLYM